MMADGWPRPPRLNITQRPECKTLNVYMYLYIHQSFVVERGNKIISFRERPKIIYNHPSLRAIALFAGQLNIYIYMGSFGARPSGGLSAWSIAVPVLIRVGITRFIV